MEMTDPAVSHHLKVLRKGGLIVSRREGKEVYYKLADTEQAQLIYKVCGEMLGA
jgi:DNA-binding transcriptional ArsR family regulator